MKTVSIEEFISMSIEAWEKKHNRKTTQKERSWLFAVAKPILERELKFAQATQGFGR